MIHKFMLGILVTLLMLTGCKQANDEMKIRNIINEMSLAIEAKNGREFIGHLDEKFQDQDGRTKKKIRATLAAIFLQNKSINVNYKVNTIKIQEDFAQVSTSVMNTDGNLIGIRSSRLSIQSQWHKRNGDWVVYRVKWEMIN